MGLYADCRRGRRQRRFFSPTLPSPISDTSFSITTFEGWLHLLPLEYILRAYTKLRKHQFTTRVI
uniref:Uncharacterized protein n=1 Tax=Brassica oleracea var. oleracea TaxID=109376 RepID=A0A0D3ASF4_BRAOL